MNTLVRNIHSFKTYINSEKLFDKIDGCKTNSEIFSVLGFLILFKADILKLQNKQTISKIDIWLSQIVNHQTAFISDEATRVQKDFHDFYPYRKLHNYLIRDIARLKCFMQPSREPDLAVRVTGGTSNRQMISALGFLLLFGREFLDSSTKKWNLEEHEYASNKIVNWLIEQCGHESELIAAEASYCIDQIMNNP